MCQQNAGQTQEFHYSWSLHSRGGWCSSLAPPPLAWPLIKGTRESPAEAAMTGRAQWHVAGHFSLPTGVTGAGLSGLVETAAMARRARELHGGSTMLQGSRLRCLDKVPVMMGGEVECVSCNGPAATRWLCADWFGFVKFKIRPSCPSHNASAARRIHAGNVKQAEV